MITDLVSLAARSPALAAFATLLERVDRPRPNLVRVLTYHRVDEPSARPALSPRVTVSPRAFDEQMRYLAAHYQVISMNELLDVYRAGATLPERAVLITFDDAYSDFETNAWPILKRYGLPVTLFVPTAYPGNSQRTFWWDHLYQALRTADRRDPIETPVGRIALASPAQREQAYTRLRAYVKTLPHQEALTWVDEFCALLGAPPPEHAVLSWDALRRLAAEGVTLGAHSQTHPLLNRVSPEQARAEAVGSLRDLEREIGPVPPVFAYPGGGITDELVRTLARDGFLAAFTTVGGINDLRRADRFRLRRINVGPRASLAILRLRLVRLPV